MLINIFDDQKDLFLSHEQVKKLAQAVIEGENVTCDEVNIYFVDVKKICALHEEFFDDPSLTDCISFPVDEDEDIFGERLLGEIFICPATAIDYASQHLLNAYEETSLYIIHGLLHLMGYDDLEEEDIILMRQAEKRHFAFLKENQLLLTH